MYSRSQIPVTLPHPSPTSSYWQDPPSHLATHRTTSSLPSTVDTVIIGSGISGASIAHGLLTSTKKREQNPETILMLEARTVCSSATGRNGGHTKHASYRPFLANLSVLGRAEALKIARLEYACMQSQHAFIRAHGIDCDALECETVDVIFDARVMAESIAAVKTLRDLLPDDLSGVARYRIYSAAEAREKFLVKGRGWVRKDGAATEHGEVVGAISYLAGSLSAYKFTCGVLALCLRHRAFNLQTRTPATALARADDGSWVVSTPRGTVRARRVVLATNGYTAALWGGFQGSIVPLRGQITAQRPGRGMAQRGLRETYSFIYREGYDYMITRPEGSRFEGDVVIGGGLTLADASGEGVSEYGTTDDSGRNAEVGGYLYDAAKRAFGSSWGEDHGEGRVRREWTGIMGYSPDGFPFVGEVPRQGGLFVSAGFQGHGMVLCWKCAEALVEIMDGEGEGLGGWFPDVYRVTEERMGMKFKGKVGGVRVKARL